MPIENKLAALGPTNIDVLLLCYGMPYVVPNSNGFHISLDNALGGLNTWSGGVDTIAQSPNPYFDSAPTFDTSPGTFDHALRKFNGKDMYLVSRLDGVGVTAGLEQVDAALYGERYISPQPGYYGGTGYVNSREGQPGGRYTWMPGFRLRQPLKPAILVPTLRPINALHTANITSRPRDFH